MTRSFLLVITALMLLVANTATAAPAIWKASDADSEVWLFGSVHVLDDDTNWKSKELQDILDEADAFYYETPTDMDAQMKIAQIVAKQGLNKDGKQLTDYLDKDQAKLLADVAADLGLPMAMLQTMKPWLANITLTMMFVQKSGYEADAGVEKVLSAMTPDDQERFFETAEEQIGFFTGLSEKASVAALVSGLEEITKQTKLFEKLIAAWVSGDMTTLDALVNDSMKDASPELYQTLIVDRNKTWAKKIVALMAAGDEDMLITVGAGHMVGDNGVPALLKAEGVTVERIQ